MGRTRLKGVRLAGFRLAIEVPSRLVWQWPTTVLEALSCSPTDPDIYVGVDVAEIHSPDWDPITYSFDGGSFEIGRIGSDWGVLVRGRNGRKQRLARIDSGFRECEVKVSPEQALRGEYPLAEPLDDLLLLHRIVRAGGLVVEGSAILREGGALAFLGLGAIPGDRTGVRESDRGRPEVATSGGRIVLLPNADGIRLHGAPWTRGAGLLPLESVRLEAIHVVSRSQRVFAERLQGETACAELLEHSYAPVHDPDSALRLMEIAQAFVARIPLLKLGLPEEQRVVPFGWGQRQAAFGFAAPTAS